MSAPLFSIITPTFNPGSKLEATLNSVREQNAAWEHVIVDGGSTDGTLDVLRDCLTPHLRWVSQPDQGVYDAMNRGIALSRGRYLYFLGAGDVLRPSVLEIVAKQLPYHECALIYGDVLWQNENRVYGGDFTPLDIARRNLPHQGAFYGRDLFTSGGFDLRYPIEADHALNIRIFGDRRAERRYLDLIVANFEGGGLSDVRQDEAFLRDRLRLVRQHLGWPLYLLCLLSLWTPPAVKRALARKKGSS